MFTQFINYTMAVGAAIAAILIGGMCLVGLIVWMSGWNWNDPKTAK